MICLIDGDLIAYRCAASCEKQGVVTEDYGIAQARANDLMVRMMQTHNTYDALVFLSGDSNFRKIINPEYKANRVEQKRPEYLAPLKQWLIEQWDAELQDNLEADDLMAIELTKDPDNRIICSLDKDMRQVPGWHYSWEITGTSVNGKQWIRPEEKLYVTPDEGSFNFYWQMMMGDSSDNVFGFDGKARQKVPKFLEDWYHEMQAMSNDERFAFVRDKYNDDNRFLMNGTCLWILRHEDDNWQESVQSLMEATGPKEDSTLS